MSTPHANLGEAAELIARILPNTSHVTRATTGVSTEVYRVEHGAGVFYLRLAEEREASLAPEVYAHTLLREQGVKVPEVVYYEPFNEALQRSVMLTTEIQGSSIEQRPFDATTLAIVRAAGADMARINRVAVSGFGWVRRDLAEVTSLDAIWQTHRDYVSDHLQADLVLLGREVLAPAEAASARNTLEAYADLPVDQAHLAHGDLDVSHIYQHDGQYSGIIDFGEMRGADMFYDLGHFRLHDSERLPQAVLTSLLEGYQEVTPLPSDYAWRIRTASLFIGVRALARAFAKPPGPYRDFLASQVHTLIMEIEQTA